MVGTSFITRTLVSIAVGAAAVGGTLLAPAAAEAAPATTRVIVMPGQALGGVSLAPAYGQLVDYLTAQGYPSQLLDLKGEDIERDAATIGATVEKLHKQHPNDKIALVAHSISGITSRTYLKLGDGHRLVDTYIAMGTAQYGSPASCTADIARENCPGTPFLRKLNAGDDTPGTTKYFGLRNAREYADGHLDGGQCRVTPMPEVAGVPTDFQHTYEPFDRNAWKLIATSLGGTCKGTYVDDPDGKLTARGSMLPDAPMYREYRG
ncbi:esterase/lipase family protein [Gordonia sp. VNK21]|uniref:esterase/lipase family protein n=1 Tax=Gordonia sp. VNK21 TaxID=3382483 RepID=UPI0038D4D6BB